VFWSTVILMALLLVMIATEAFRPNLIIE
jgi:hypothetical protein